MSSELTVSTVVWIKGTSAQDFPLWLLCKLARQGKGMVGESLATGWDTVADRAARVAAAAAGGLSSAEAAGRLARYGPNELPRARRTPLWRLVADQLRDPLILVLLVIRSRAAALPLRLLLVGRDRGPVKW